MVDEIGRLEVNPAILSSSGLAVLLQDRSLDIDDLHIGRRISQILERWHTRFKADWDEHQIFRPRGPDSSIHRGLSLTGGSFEAFNEHVKWWMVLGCSDCGDRGGVR